MIIMMKNYSILEMKEYMLSQERNVSRNFYSKLLITLVKLVDLLSQSKDYKKAITLYSLVYT